MFMYVIQMALLLAITVAGCRGEREDLAEADSQLALVVMTCAAVAFGSFGGGAHLMKIR